MTADDDMITRVRTIILLISIVMIIIIIIMMVMGMMTMMGITTLEAPPCENALRSVGTTTPGPKF